MTKLDDFTQCVLDSIESTQRFWERACKNLDWYTVIPFEKIYADFMASIDKESLTELEKTQALLDYILEGEHDQT